MKRLFLLFTMTSVLMTASTAAQVPVERVATDAQVLDRVAEFSRRDLPTDLLKRLVTEDIELLRGRRPDGSYEFASYERFESGRVSSDFSAQPRTDEMQTVELKGANVYRVGLEVPNRRMVIRRNRPVWVERVDVDFVPQGSTQSKQQSFEVKAWLQPGETRSIELPDIARQATVKTIITADPESGYGNIEIALVQARIVDNAMSPYAEAVTAAKAALRAVEGNDATQLRGAASRMRDALGGRVSSGSSLTVTARPPEPPAQAPGRLGGGESAARAEFQAELQLIEDLLTGSEAERRQGMDRLHQLIRQLRP
jgi:hypothetical protein